jgi:VanZ family protein
MVSCFHSSLFINHSSITMFVRYNLFGIVWAIIIFMLILMPGHNMPDTNIWSFLTFDKFAHFFVFAVLVLLLIIGYTKQYTYTLLKFNAVKSALITGIGYSLILECGQALVPERTFDLADVLANTIGCFLGSLLFYFVYKFNIPN